MDGAPEETIQRGDEVVAVDGERVGTLATVVDGYLIIEKGRVFPKDYEVPVAAIDSYDAADGVIALAVPRDQVQACGMGQREPADATDPVA